MQPSITTLQKSRKIWFFFALENMIHLHSNQNYWIKNWKMMCHTRGVSRFLGLSQDTGVFENWQMMCHTCQDSGFWDCPENPGLSQDLKSPRLSQDAGVFKNLKMMCHTCRDSVFLGLSQRPRTLGLCQNRTSPGLSQDAVVFENWKMLGLWVLGLSRGPARVFEEASKKYCPKFGSSN